MRPPPLLFTFPLVLSTLLLACEAPPAPPESTAAAPITVHVTGVRRGTIADVLTVTGETAALRVLRLASPVSGRVTFLNVQAGDQLAADEVAARVMPAENEAALHGFSMLERSGVLGAREIERARRLRRDLGARDIPLRAPFAAVVADRLHNPGEQVAQGDVLLELFDPHSLYVVAQAPLEKAAAIGAGMPVQVDGASSRATGQIAVVLTALQPQTVTVPLRISLNEPLEPPLLHAAVQCRITLARHTDALLIPRSALLTSTVAEQGTVMVAARDRAERRSVQLGLRSQTDVEIVDGLAAGDHVLVEGQYSLPDGTLIHPVQAAAE
jgi:membrane fusion protein (multidrug efflux system)